MLASELLARVMEDSRGFLSDVSDRDVAREFGQLNKELGVIRRLSEAVASNPRIDKDRNTILIFHFQGEQRLEIRSFESITPAQRAYSELEKELAGQADVVLVKAERADDLRRSFQNYFTDAQEFVSLVTDSYDALR